MRGTGSDDYVWIYFDGHAAELNANIHNPPLWGNDLKIELKIPGPRVGIHLADWTGDGKCDVLVQNEATGALTLYENTYKTGAKSVIFTNKGVVTPATCSQGWGVSPFDRGMRLADIDGDGRADVMCLEPNGHVENSGRADIIYLDKYTGADTVFKNLGRKSGTGSDPKLPKYSTGDQDGGTDDGSEDGGGSGDDCSKPTFDGDSKVIPNKGKLVQIARYDKAKDKWELLSDDPLKDAAAWGQNLDIVAPGVIRDGGQWVMYYSGFTQDDHDGKRCMGVAFSDSTRGPYTPRDEPFVCHLDKGGVIDPSAFYDPGSNTRWVVYKIEGNRTCGKTSIMLQQVENDGFTLKNDPVEIFSETDDEKLLETPSLVYEDDSYLLFYSSGCYTSDKYSIKYATSGSISGPYDRGDGNALGSIAGSIQSPGNASSNVNGHLLFE
ncbi:acetylxylan esterase [Fusarium agapanthi]|uniref:Acetylxylan esterase n=1 Tax=Fusarium agapanthi TaxID=1803897 RepID=A0A9P5BLH9_9HYPO|nr:acetylxylan esterase [Fusarium agapanthi]